MSNAPDDRAPLDLVRLIYRAHRTLQGIGGAVAEGNGLFVGEMDAIITLGRAGGMRMGDMARAMVVSAPNATRIVKQLEGRGLVRRGRSATSDREVIVRLTPKGEEAFQGCLPQLERDSSLLVDAVLSAEEQRQLRVLLEKLAKKSG